MRYTQLKRHAANKQKGATLILIMFILGLGVAAFTIKSFTAVSAQARQDEETMKALGEAKAALIAWSVAHPNWPGIMPFPDRAETTPPANYDGKSDCVTSGLNTTHLLGKLPLLGDAPCITPQKGLGIKALDAVGERLWYAVSINLIRTNGSASTPVINPGIIDAPTNQWMQVLDRNGLLISDRVAAVIIAPGLPLGGQDRSGAAPPPAAFLDSLQIGAKVYSNQDYDSDDEDFIIGDDSSKLSPADTTYQSPYNFNDKVVFITIDELMAAVEKRAAAVAIDALEDYRTENDGSFPLAAQLGTTVQYACEPAKYEGFLPLDNHTCTKISSSSSSSFSCSAPSTPISAGITSVRFRTPNVLAPFLLNSGACFASLDSCTCTGAGQCNGATFSFSCDSQLNCNSTGINGSYQFSGGKFSTSTGSGCSATEPTKTAAGCTIPDSTVNCTASGTTSFSTCGDAYFGAGLPAWFRSNSWQNYIFYTRSTTSPGNIAAGGKTQLDALLITTGRPIDSAPFADSKPAAEQEPPSCDALNNYLDSIENVDPDNVYDGITQARTRNYNDQVFTVAP